MVVFLVSVHSEFKQCCALEDATVSCAVHVLVVFIVTPCLFYVILQADGKAKAPCFCGKKMPPVFSWRTVTMVLLDHKVVITKQFKYCSAYLSRKGIRAPVRRLAFIENTNLESTESQCNSPQLMQLQLKLHSIRIILYL